jgi:osmotically-inducible protein OsmY
MQTQNEIQVPLNDIELETRITASLVSQHVPSLRNASVEARGDSVVLRGEVNSFYAKQLSHHSALRLAGSTRVIDEVRVFTPATFRDVMS